MKQIILVLIIVSLFLVGCTPAEEATKTSGEVMKVAKYYWPGNFWIEIADEKGFFEEAGLNVELVDTNIDYEASLQDMVDGKMDTNDFALFGLMNFVTNGADLAAVLSADISSGADAIVAKQEIEHIADLRGKTIGVDKGSYLEYILDVALGKNGLTSEDVVKKDISAEEAAEEFIAGNVDAIVTWEPIVTEAIEKGNGRKLFDTSQIPGISPSAFAFHKSFIDSHPNDVQAFVNVWHRTTEFMKEEPGEAFGIIAKNYGVSAGEVQAFTQQDKLRDLRDNKIAFSYSAGFESLHGTASQINRFMNENNITDKRLDSTDFIDARFIRAVKE
jgi:NitT/TauT family transport system substrate-binding protein